MLNERLRRLAADAGLDHPRHEPVRLALGLACVQRVQHLIEQPRADALLQLLADAVQSQQGAASLHEAAREGAALARSHPGSASLDASGHSAVSATHALARALAGRAVDAAEYAAYALVYSYGRYAVADPTAFEPEFDWQVAQLRALLPA